MLGLIALAVWLRWPALGTAGFHNEDVAGITLNADLILRGELPLIDNLEYKAPGTFYLTAMLWTLLDRSMFTLQCFGIGMACFALLGVFCLGRILYRRDCGLVAATLYIAAIANYRQHRRQLRVVDDRPLHLGNGLLSVSGEKWSASMVFWTGVILAIAGVLKRQAAVLFPLFALMPLIGQRLELAR